MRVSISITAETKSMIKEIKKEKFAGKSDIFKLSSRGNSNKYVNGFSREALDPILDNCADEYKKLEEDDQIDFKENAKAFVKNLIFF